MNIINLKVDMVHSNPNLVELGLSTILLTQRIEKIRYLLFFFREGKQETIYGER